MPGAIVAGCGDIVMPLFIVAKTLPGLLVSRASLVKNTPVSPWTWAIEPVGNAQVPVLHGRLVKLLHTAPPTQPSTPRPG
jgi:hypothetical protein